MKSTLLLAKIDRLETRRKNLLAMAATLKTEIRTTSQQVADALDSERKVPPGRLKALLKSRTGADHADVEITKDGREIVDVWAYHPGFTNSAMGPGCHLIHESSVARAYDVLKDGLTKCDCEDCLPVAV